MNPTTLAAMFAVILPGVGAARTPSHPSLPWLFNLGVVAAAESDDLAAAVPDDTLGPIREGCSAGARATVALRADVSPAAGVETVVASYAGGIRVLDAEARLIASAPGYPCGGSADGLDVLAAGTAFGVPTIVLALSTGGRRESLTWLGLYRVGHGGRLEAVFAGAVEQRDDERVVRGSVTILPGAILHREPTGETIVWAWDEGVRVYVPHPLREEIPHS